MHNTSILYDLDGHMIDVGSVLRCKDNELGMVHRFNNRDFIGWNRRPYQMYELPHYADQLDQAYINKMHMRIDRGRWMTLGGTVKVFPTYDLAKMSDLFGTPEIVYFSEDDIKFMRSVNNEDGRH